ncbi:MAG: sugar transferase [Gemmatimonadota bacterium]|nr:sugar transferase [Gemmatimonadota bacterium]
MSVDSIAIEGSALKKAPEEGLSVTTEGADGLARPAQAAVPHLSPVRHALPAELAEALDTGAVLLVLLAVWVMSNWERMPGVLDDILVQKVTIRSALLVGGFILLWPRILALTGMYDITPLRRRDEILRAAAACSIGSILALIFPLVKITGSFSPQSALFFWLASFGLMIAIRAPLWALAASVRARMAPRRILIIGSGPRALKLSRDIHESTDRTCELIGFVDSDDNGHHESMDVAKLGTLEELEKILMHHVVDEVLIALPIKSCYSQIQGALQVCERVGVESKYLADAFRCSLAKPRFESDSALPLVSMKVFYDDYRVSVKRLIDFVGAVVGLVVLAPVLIAIAIAIKLDSSGPVIFAQERYGRNKRRFRMYKFRTMVPNAAQLQAHLEDMNEAVGPVFKIKNDPRVTRVGKWLRKTSLDELPQLVNVLLGHMSLVGPRPMAVRDVQLFDQAWFMRRFSAPPGMTGLWQVSGRSNLGFDDWVALDLKYIDDWSLGLDLRILAKTIPVVLRGDGAA